MDIGKNLREVRERQGLMVSEVARRASLTVSGVTSIETGRVQRPAAETVVRLARALGVEPGELLKEDSATVGKAEVLPVGPQSRLECALERYFVWLREEERRSKLEEVESCVQYALDRAKYYQQEIERGRPEKCATYERAYDLAVQAVAEFSTFTTWLIDDGPARPLWERMEQGVGLEIEEEYDALIEKLIDRISLIQLILFENAAGLAETEAQKEKIAAEREEIASSNAQLARRGG
jgi:transcriptional regulator with XRE-family HTH domain